MNAAMIAAMDAISAQVPVIRVRVPVMAGPIVTGVAAAGAGTVAAAVDVILAMAVAAAIGAVAVVDVGGIRRTHAHSSGGR